MQLKKIVIILSLAVPLTFCKPSNSVDLSNEKQQLLTEENEIEFSTSNSTFLIPENSKVGEEETLKLAKESDWAEDQETWIAPLHIQRTFPFFISGFDDYSRPIYIVQLGKMDLRSIVDQGVEAQEATLKYILQRADGIKKYLKKQKTDDGKSVTGAVAIYDFGGLTTRQLTPANLAFLLQVTLEMREFVDQYLSEVYVVNVNFVAHQLLELSKPVLGKALEHFTFFGTDQEKWKPVIRRTFGPHNLPEYYGGNPDWKPVKYYGIK